MHVFSSKSILLSLIIFLALLSNNTLTASSTSAWHNTLSTTLGFSQTSLDNWASGGDETSSWLWHLKGEFNQISDSHEWTHFIKHDYGQTRSGGSSARKSNDELRYETVYTFKSNPKINPFVSFLLLTQLDEGKQYGTTPPTTVSFAFDPTYLTQSAGLDYQLSKPLSIRLGAAAKQTLVDKTTITKEKSETGAEAVFSYKDTWLSTLNVSSSLQLFSSLDVEDEMDVYWDVSLTSKIADYISWLYNFNLIYDADVSTKRQIKQTTNVGITFHLI